MSDGIDDAITCHGQSWSGIGCIVCIKIENALHASNEGYDEGWVSEYE